MRLFLVGFGGVGKKMAAILLTNLKPDSQGSADMIELARTVTVVAITTKSRGSLYNAKGIDLGRALSDLKWQDSESESVKGGGGKHVFSESNPDLFASSSRPCATAQLINEADYDVLVELSPLSIKSGCPLSSPLSCFCCLFCCVTMQLLHLIACKNHVQKIGMFGHRTTGSFVYPKRPRCWQARCDGKQRPRGPRVR